MRWVYCYVQRLLQHCAQLVPRAQSIYSLLTTFIQFGWLVHSAVSHIIRDTAAGRSGPITPIGLGTFVDPREQVCVLACIMPMPVYVHVHYHVYLHLCIGMCLCKCMRMRMHNLLTQLHVAIAYQPEICFESCSVYCCLDCFASAAGAVVALTGPLPRL